MLAFFAIIVPHNVFAEDKTLSIQYQDQSYDVRTSLTNGMVNGIELDPDFTSIILDIETSGGQEGVLTITLPRALIDARQGNSTNVGDDKFVIVVGNNEVDYEETDNSNDNQRELKINVPAGTTRIEIVGTQVAPEFHFIMISLMLVFIVATIFSRQAKGKTLEKN
jgi:hypothetical protein